MEVQCSDIEWTIKNFSCWNYQIHTNKISLRKKDIVVAEDWEKFLELYPRGVSCHEDRLVMRFFNEWFSGNLEISIIGSDGSLIETESMIIRDHESEFYVGPTFETCVASIREDESFYNDSLTLRFQKKGCIYSKLHVRLVIGVFNASIKINSKIFKERDFKKDAWNVIFRIEYPLHDGVCEYLEFLAFKIDCGGKTNVKLKLVPVYVRSNKTIAKVSTFYQLGKGAVVKFQDVEHVFTMMCEQASMKSLPIVEDWERNFYVILHLKITREKPFKSHDYACLHPCEIKMDSANSSKTLGTAASLRPDASVDVLRKEMTRLYQDLDYCDFQLRCGESVFPVHKGILSARSPVFKSMLSSNMREAVTGTVDIEDLEPFTLNSFLSFLYSGTVDDLQWESAIKLYYAADKYQVDTLKRECATALCGEISVSNICEILLVADKHQDPKLTSIANNFLMKNYDRIRKTQKWMDFIDLYPRFFMRAVELLFEKKMTLFPC